VSTEHPVPTSLAHIIGQRTVVDQLRVALDACFEDHKRLDDALLVGPPGLGKSQIASVTATSAAKAISSLRRPHRRRQAVSKSFGLDVPPSSAWRVEDGALHRGEVAIDGSPHRYLRLCCWKPRLAICTAMRHFDRRYDDSGKF